MLQIIHDREDIKALAAEMYRLAADHLQSTPIETKPDIMAGEQVCEKLGISIQTLNIWRKKGKVPFLQIGSAIRYDFNKVVSALEVLKKKSTTK